MDINILLNTQIYILYLCIYIKRIFYYNFGIIRVNTLTLNVQIYVHKVRKFLQKRYIVYYNT